MKLLRFIIKVTVKTIICYNFLFPISSLADTNNVQLLIKKTAKKGNLVDFPRGLIAAHEDYIDLLKGLPVVIDRTLFMNFILDIRLGDKGATNAFVITAPSRWGKTVMLKMVNFFFSPELDKFKKVKITETKAYEFFKNGKITTTNGEMQQFEPVPLISSSKKLDTYITQHPVVNLDFALLYKKGDTLETVIRKSFVIIRDLGIWEHTEVIQHLCTTKKNIDDEEVQDIAQLNEACRIFYQIYYQEPNEVTEEEVPSLFTKLLYLLHIFYKKRVVVLIDEYGSILHNLYIPKEKGESMPSPNVRIPIEGYYESLLASFLKNCKRSPNLLLTMMTGVIPVTVDVGLSGLNNIDFYNFMDEDLYEFYGLEHEISMKLMRYAGFNDSRSKQNIVNFDHFEMPSKTGMTRFNPWSILQMVYGTSETYPWLIRTPTQFLKLVVKTNKEVRHTLQQLVFGRCLDYNYLGHIKFTTQDLLNVGQEAVGMNENDEVKITFLQYLVHMGLLTVTREKEYQEKIKSLKKLENKLKKEEEEEENVYEESICVKIPNLENMVIIGEVLTDYEITNNNILETSIILAEMLSNHSVSCDKFREKFKSFLQRGGKNLIRGSELYYHSLLLVKMVLPLQTIYNYEYLANYGLNRDPSTPDIMMQNGTHGGIFEVKYNAASSVIDDAYTEQLPRYGTIFHRVYPNIKQLRLMLIHVKEKQHQDRNKLITVTMKERCFNTSRGFEELEKIYQNNENKGTRK